MYQEGVTPIPGPAGMSQAQALIRGHLHLKTRLGQGQEGLTPTPYPVGLSRARALNRVIPSWEHGLARTRPCCQDEVTPTPGSASQSQAQPLNRGHLFLFAQGKTVLSGRGDPDPEPRRLEPDT